MRSGEIIDDQGKMNNFAIEPKMSYVENGQSQFGFNPYAEKLNGRLAMIGFVSAIVLEIVTGHGVVGFLTGL
ncbi:chlorophyll a/b-binding protein [Alkalinema pantanalense CENA528]|uniref:chlorophyll a/b-binding protein n=1 Tax=Alkalinema pantanalense TaxID=1620705 RepID=UPI003D6DC88E